MKLFIFQVIEGSYVDGSITVVASSEDQAMRLIEEKWRKDDEYLNKYNKHREEFSMGVVSKEAYKRVLKNNKFRMYGLLVSFDKIISDRVFHHHYWYGLTHCFSLAPAENPEPRIVAETFHDG